MTPVKHVGRSVLHCSRQAISGASAPLPQLYVEMESLWSDDGCYLLQSTRFRHPDRADVEAELRGDEMFQRSPGVPTGSDGRDG